MESVKAGNLVAGHLTLVRSDTGLIEARCDIDGSDVEFLRAHAVHGIVMLPGTFHVELAVETLATVCSSAARRITNLQFHEPVVVAADQSVWIRLTQDDRGWYYECFRCNAERTPEFKTVVASLRIEDAGTDAGEPVVPSPLSDLAEWVTGLDFYHSLRTVGNQYGPEFQTIERIGVDPETRRVDADLASQQPHRGQVRYDPLVMDAAVQAVSSLVEIRRSAYVLSAIASVRAYDTSAAPSQLRVIGNRVGASELVGHAVVVSSDGEVITELEGVRIRFLDVEAQTQSLARASRDVESGHSKSPLRIAATFTAEPIEESLEFWGNTLSAPFDVRFAPYNQVLQQLLDPKGHFLAEEFATNVILLRLEDWIRETRTVPLQVSESEKTSLLANQSVRRLPNGIDVAQLNPYETDYVFKEIFQDRCYMKHGIELNDGDTVIDIGANIGLFTMFIQQECHDSTVLCFDPSPPVFEALKRNTALYGVNVKPFNCGISSLDGEATFTYYEKSSVFSSFHADASEDEAAVREVVLNMLSDGGLEDDDERERFADELMADRMNSIPYRCQLRTLSSVIREEGLTKIDLLKVDAEKSELQVLQGIDEEHWPMIKQIVIEVHDRQGPLIDSVRTMLTERGFTLEIEEEELLKNSGLYNIFGTRGEHRAGHGGVSRHEETLHRWSDEFTDALQQAAKRSSNPWLVAICPSSPSTGKEVRLGERFAQIEKRIITAFEGHANVEFLRAEEVERLYPVETCHDPDGDRLGHVPYTREYFAALGSSLARRIDGMRRLPSKVIVLDCDNTLWKGVAGEDGPAGIELSEPFRALQQFMVEQHDAGMLLCLCSKNDEADIEAVFEARREMPLTGRHIVARRINWQPKSQNIRELAAELNLGLDSFIFIDDNPVECAEVAANAPQVLTLQLPQESAEIPTFLRNVWVLDHQKVTDEDRNRTAMYQQSLARDQFRNETTTLADFLSGLNLEIQIVPPREDQLARVAQLTQRTNQFNCTTIRRDAAQLQAEMKDGLHVLAVTVRDRFGDYGLVGDIFYRLEGSSLVVDTFLLSCRVLGRGVEHRMLAKLGTLAQEMGSATVVMPFVRTEKNEPAFAFLRSLGPDLDKTDANGLRFEVPVAVAAATVYEPGGIESQVNPASSSETSTPARAARSSVSYQRIAGELRSVEAILREVGQSQSSKRTTEVEFVAPKPGLQRSIAEIWCSVLAIDQVGVNDNFRDLGGTSLKAVQLIAKLKQELGFEMAIVDLFENPTVRDLAKKLGEPSSETNEQRAKDRGSMRRQQRRARRRRS